MGRQPLAGPQDPIVGPPLVAGVLSDIWNGRTWQVAATPEPRGQLRGHLASVSCVTPDRCRAVGETATEGTLAEGWNGARWRILRIASP